ncbi:MAG: biopolymer transporter ExbD, partial [Pseudomonadota bacterium]
MGANLNPGGGRHRPGRTRPMAEINVTPFVDVMLVLLIVFMVAAPLLTVGVSVDRRLLDVNGAVGGDGHRQRLARVLN